MKLKLLLRLVPLIFFLSLIGLNAQTVTVNAGGGADYTTIQAAIDDIRNSIVVADIIEVAAGTYTENLDLQNTTDLTLRGAQFGVSAGVGAARDASSTLGETIVVGTINTGGGTTFTVDGLTIDGFRFENTSFVSAIRVKNDVIITNSIIHFTSTYFLISVAGNAGMEHTLTLTNSNLTGSRGFSIDNARVTAANISNNVFNTTSASLISASSLDGVVSVTDNEFNSPRGLNLLTNNNIITGNVFNVPAGVDNRGMDIYEVTGNTITGNTFSEDALSIYVRTGARNEAVLDNLIEDNKILGGINNITGKSVNAEWNWWGHATGPYHATTNPTGLGGEVSDDVLYSPWYGNDPDEPRDPDVPWTFYVNGTNPDGIQDLIDDIDVLDGDVIFVIGPGPFNSFVVDKELVFKGFNDPVITNASPAITISSHNVTLDGLTFSFDSALDYAVEVDGDYSGIIVKNCNFFNTDGGGVNPGLGIDNDNGGPYYVLAYENNDWGDASGPTHASNPGGTGVTISDYVIYEWEGLQEPIHSITGVSIEPTFVWGELKTGPAATIEYQLIISVNSDLSAPLFDENVGTVLTYNTNEDIPNFPLTNNTKYYWQVIALDGNSDPIYESEVNFFTTVTNINISLYNPGDQIQLYAYDPAMFTWGISQTQGSLKYYLQIKAAGTAPTTAEWFADVDAEITTPGSIDFFYDHQSNSWRNVNGLTGGTRYYWRVVAYYDDGSTPNAFDHEDRVVKYSQVFYFDTQGGAVKAYPSWPTGGATIYYLDPTFYWYTMQWEPGATFEVIYSDDSTEVGGVLSNPLATISAGSNMYVYIGTDLDPSTQYYWQVETTYGVETNYSSIATFTTYDAPGLVPTAANPSYPTGGLEIYTTAPYFYWWIGAMNIDVNFEVEVSTDNTFGTIDFTFGPTTDLYVQGSGLIPGEYYYWRVKSSKIGYADVYSTTAEFSVTGGLNSYPVANWPVGNPTLYTNTPTLSWYMEGSTLGWFHYKVVWSKKDKTPAQWLAQVLANDSIYVTSDMNETFYTFTSPLEYGETYYWAVAAHDHPAGPYSDFAEGSFTIAGNDANILLTNPANNSIILTKSPTFYWYVTGSMLGVTHFRVTYSNTELFNANVETVVTTTTSATVNGPLTEGATYWWYVELSYDGGGTWENPSSVWKFTVDAGASAVMPLVGSPARGVSIGTNSPTLSWYLPTQSQSALSYEVELSNSPDFSNATKYDNIAQLNSQVTDLTEGEYYWRVRSKTSGSTSNYSNTGNFKVGSVTSLEGEEELPLSYSIDQNYPNPFNPTTTINYSLPEANFVTIKIYNMLGQEVKTLLSEEVKAGRHNVNWNGENNYGSKVSSGTYIYRITAGEFVQAKKMILLK